MAEDGRRYRLLENLLTERLSWVWPDPVWFNPPVKVWTERGGPTGGMSRISAPATRNTYNGTPRPDLACIAALEGMSSDNLRTTFEAALTNREE
jgi:hypothetical protein